MFVAHVLRILVSILVGVALCAGGVSAGEKVYTLKYSYISPELTPKENHETMLAYVMKDYLEKQSKGRIKMDIYPAGQLGAFREMIQGTMSGSIELSLINAIPLNSFYRESMIFGLPGAFESADECNAVLNGDWGKKFNEGIRQKLGLRVLNHHSSGLRHFTNSKKLLKSPEDAKGLTFRVMESPISIRMVESLGAKAVPIPSSEMYVAMQNGVVDGQENPISSILHDKTFEVQKYVVLDGHFPSTMMLIMNDKLFSGMPQDLQEVVVKGAELGYREAVQVLKAQEEQGIALLKQKGMTVYTPTKDELKRWHAAIAGPTQRYVREQMGDKPVDEFLAAIASLRK